MRMTREGVTVTMIRNVVNDANLMLVVDIGEGGQGVELSPRHTGRVRGGQDCQLERLHLNLALCVGQEN